MLIGCLAAIFVGCSDTDDTGDSMSAGPTESTVGSDDPPVTLPDLHFERPDMTSAAWTETQTYLTINEAGAIGTVTQQISVTADYASSTTRVEVRNSSKPEVATVMFTPSHVYASPASDGKSWTRRARTTVGPRAMDRPDHLDMYEDIVTSSVRSDATDVISSTDDVDGNILTTYAFTTDSFELPRRDKTTTSGAPSIDVIAGTLELTVDETGLVRRWHSAVNDGLARLMMRSNGVGSMLVSATVEIISHNEPVTVGLPTEFVDEDADPVDGG
ncbi:MAG: hypothetical protein JWN99_1332 [Ilumatobacteraceae bacterium]|nr:hypothetical protein [Ilumatobacteraceae bacterium]